MCNLPIYFHIFFFTSRKKWDIYTFMKDSDSQSPNSVTRVLTKIMRPLVRFALAKRIPIQSMIDILKRLYIEVCQKDFSLSDKRLTDSRVSILTGLQRKDIKALRQADQQENNSPPTISPLSRVIAHWQGSPEYKDGKGEPLSLPKIGKEKSFETLVGEISHDIHPRTILDDLLSLGYITLEDDTITLVADAFVPNSDEESLFNYLANNLGDHSEAAVANVLEAPNKAPYFERAVHYNKLSQASLDELDTLSRKLQQSTLEKINARALELQKKDKANSSATGRFRCGAFIYNENYQQANKDKN